MASLRKRGSVYYVVFSRRRGERVSQAACSLGTSDERLATKLKYELEDRYASGEIDPFSGWNYIDEKAGRDDVAQDRPITLQEGATQFLESRAHVSERTRFDYQSKLERLKKEWGSGALLREITGSDVRAFCYAEKYSRATQATYLRFCRMFFA